MISANKILLRSCSISLKQNAAFAHRGRQVQKYKKKNQKSIEDEKWEFQKAMNPFASNVGMSRQMRVLNVDADDAVFKAEDATDALPDADVTLEGMRDRAKAIREKFRADAEHQAVVAKSKIIYKKVYAGKPQPNLLTWMEKEMIKYLHKDDPKEWTIDRLAESFPATGSVVLSVLKEKTMLNEKRINEYNKDVTSNWKKLSRGLLELEPEYAQHLKSGYKTLRLSSGLKNLAEQDIMIQLENKTSPLPKPAIPGEFARIIIDYNNKVAKKKQEENEINSDKVIDVPQLFSDNTIPGTPFQNEISPYTGTSLLATNIDLRKEKRMDVEEFRNKFLGKSSVGKKGLDTDLHPLREKYLQWVHKEEKKSRKASKHVPKLESADVHEIVDEGTKEPGELIKSDVRKVEEIEVKYSPSGGMYIFDAESGCQPLDVQSDNPDFINIPEEVKYKYNFFQMGDTVYDRDGYFLYSVPGLGNQIK